MPLFREKLIEGSQHAHVPVRLGFLRFLARLRQAIFSAAQDEADRAYLAASEKEQDVLLDLPDQLDMDSGEMKYGSGMHRYF
jgi:hypothetical protein